MTLDTLEPQQADGRLEKFSRFPCPQGPITGENEPQYVGFTNDLQGMLALRKFGTDSGHAEFAQWFEKFSTAFRETFDDIVGEDPLYFDGIATIGDIPEDKWEEIESRLYGTGANNQTA